MPAAPAAARLKAGRRLQKPAPATFWDWIACVAPINFLPGDQALVDYFQGVRDEIKGRIDAGVSGVRNERYRLYFDGIMNWNKLGFLFRNNLQTTLDKQALDLLEEEWSAALGYLTFENQRPVWFYDGVDPDETAIVWPDVFQHSYQHTTDRRAHPIPALLSGRRWSLHQLRCRTVSL